MARPSKSVSNMNRHATNEEKAQREAAEKAALTGMPMREETDVAGSPVAHEEFLRVSDLLTKVQKNDAMYEAVINRYARLKADGERYLRMRCRMEGDLDAIEENEELDAEDKYKLRAGMYKNIMGCDAKIQSFEKIRGDIEKENGFTIAAALRAIPKTPVKAENPLKELLNESN